MWSHEQITNETSSWEKEYYPKEGDREWYEQWKEERGKEIEGRWGTS